MCVDGTAQGGSELRCGPYVADPENGREARLHTIVDHSLIEVIVNNRTALTVSVSPSGIAASGTALIGASAASEEGGGEVEVTAQVDCWQLESANQ